LPCPHGPVHSVMGTSPTSLCIQSNTSRVAEFTITEVVTGDEEAKDLRSGFFDEAAIDDRSEFIVDLCAGIRSPWKIGLTISAADDPTYVTIDEVWAPSLISAWNEVHSDALKVRVGDVIIAANDISGDGTEIMDRIASAGHALYFETLLLEIWPKHRLKSLKEAGLQPVHGMLRPENPRGNALDFFRAAANGYDFTNGSA